MLARNVADNVEPPKRGDREILKASDVPAVLDALKTSRLYAIVTLALSSGARRSELLALRWCDVDLERAVIKIEHSLEQTKAGLRLKAPKTKRGQRSIKLPPFVFCNFDGSPISPNDLSIMWSRALARTGLPKVTFHSLRHSHALALIRAGLDVVRVSRQLGHSKPNHHPLDLCA